MKLLKDVEILNIDHLVEVEVEVEIKIEIEIKEEEEVEVEIEEIDIQDIRNLKEIILVQGININK